MTSFKGLRRRHHIANDTLYASVPGCGAATATPPTGPGGHPGRPGVDQLLHPTPRTRRSADTSSPASAARTTMMLDHYQQTKNLLVSYSNKAQGFF